MDPPNPNSNQLHHASRSKNRFGYHGDPRRSMAAEVMGLALNFNLTGDESYLKRAEDAMRLGAPELGQNVLQHNSQLLQFVNAIDEPPTEEMAEKALEDIQSLWPSATEGLTLDMLLQIHHCIRVSKVTIRYNHLRLFLVHCACSIGKTHQPLDDAKANEIALDAEKFMSKAMAVDERPRSDLNLSSGVFPDWLDADADLQEETIRHADLMIQALRDALGDHTVAATLPEIWERYGNAPDKDSAMNYAAHVHRFNVSSLAQILNEIKEQVQESVETKRELSRKLRESE
ncbi:hypothetical protein KCU65_g3405, partial [Aureobasidium melanogenum]